MISHDVIEDLKYRNSIEDVISSYVTLSRSGSNLKGLCPFHSEKSPSFTVYTGDGHFYCFGCGAAGDVISFIMRIENLDYRAALEFLAARSGITLPEEGDKQQIGTSRSRVLEMNLCAARFFRETLFSPEGMQGLAYFTSRGLSPLTIKRFGLGYAPNSYDSLKKHLRSKGFTDDEMVDAYLCQRSQKNTKNTYDCFRNRVMFPIIDVTGNVVAFGGRVLDDSKPKYLNSSDTPAFKKSRHLFALNYAKNHAGENGLILCEGYMDVIALHAAGFENAVATLGTAITADHARIIRKYSETAVISYDSDEAGQKAADKALRLLGEAGVEARVLTIPGAKDPDEYIKTHGKERFAEVLKGSRTGFDHKINKILSKYDIQLDNGRANAARDLCNIVASEPSKVNRDIYCQRVAKVLSLDVKSVKSEVERIVRISSAKAKKDMRGDVIRVTSGIGDRVDPDYAKDTGRVKLERAIIGLMLEFPEFARLDRERELLSEDMFSSELNKRLYSSIKNNGDEFEIGMLSETFTQEEVSRAYKMINDRNGLSNDRSVFESYINDLKARPIKGNAEEDFAAVLERRRKEVKK